MATKPPAGLRPTQSTDRSIRIEDYLNDKFQTQDDLENLGLILENLKKQQSLLHTQVCFHPFTQYTS